MTCGLRWRRFSLAGALILAILAGCGTTCRTGDPATMDEPRWLTSFDEAVARAQRSGKPILACFNGDPSDPWGDAFCYKLQNEVFDTEKFKAWAAENVVLFQRQFPVPKSRDRKIAPSDAKLLEKYNVKEFPTIIFMTPEGEQIGIMGYQRGGATPWIEDAKTFLAAE